MGSIEERCNAHWCDWLRCRTARRASRCRRAETVPAKRSHISFATNDTRGNISND